MQHPRVLYLIDTYYIGGAGKVLLQFLKNSDSSRFSYLLGTFRYRNPPSTEFIDTAKGFGFPLRLFRQNFLFDPAPLWQVWSTIRRERINILETHGYKSHLLGWLLHRFSGVRWIGVTHGWTSENAKMRLYGTLDRFLLKKADRVITVSPVLQRTMEEIRGGGTQKTSLVLNGVDVDMIGGKLGGKQIRSQLGIADSALLIGIFGRLSSEKGQGLAIGACEHLLKTSKLKLVLVGEGPDREKLETQVRDQGLQDAVIFVGQQPAIRDYYEAIDLLLLPSLSEGLPFVLLEAMALGKPVVATRVGAVPEVVESGRNGWLVPPGDVAAMRDMLQSVCTDRLILREMGRVGRQSIYPRFSARRQSDEVLAIYEQLSATDGSMAGDAS